MRVSIIFIVTSRYMYGIVFLALCFGIHFLLTSMSIENHANMAASCPSSTLPPHHSYFPSTFPTCSSLSHPHTFPSSMGGNSACASRELLRRQHAKDCIFTPLLSLSLSLSQWFFSSFFPLLHSSPFSPWFMLESSAFMPMVPLQQPPPSSSLPPTYAHLTTLFLATMAAGATLLIPTSTLLCLCFSRSLGTGPELSPLLSIGYPAGRVATCRAGSTIPLSTDHKPDRYDERQGIEDAGGFCYIYINIYIVG